MPAPPGKEVRAMFDSIAMRYDFLNRFLSFGIDKYWRKKTLRIINPAPDSKVLDLCCGTGDLSLEFAKKGCEVVGVDFSFEMLSRGPVKSNDLKKPVKWTQADAQQLPFSDNSFDIVSIAFGIRNVEDVPKALKECLRVLHSGGTLVILEFFPIQNFFWRNLFRLYFHVILPILARIVPSGRTGAYNYLPQSVDGFYSSDEFYQLLLDAGFSPKQKKMTGGVARLFFCSVK